MKLFKLRAAALLLLVTWTTVFGQEANYGIFDEGKQQPPSPRQVDTANKNTISSESDTVPQNSLLESIILVGNVADGVSALGQMLSSSVQSLKKINKNRAQKSYRNNGMKWRKWG